MWLMIDPIYLLEIWNLLTVLETGLAVLFMSCIGDATYNSVFGNRCNFNRFHEIEKWENDRTSQNLNEISEYEF